MFPSFNLCMFTEEDCTTINNEDRSIALLNFSTDDTAATFDYTKLIIIA